MMNYLYLVLYVGLLWLFPFAGKAAEPDWSCDAHAYEYDMSLYLALQKDNQVVTGDFLLAAFCGDECRGVAELQSVGDASFYYMRVRSNQESGESISFKVYDRSADEVSDISGGLRFVHLQQVGFPSRPWLLILPAVIDPENGLEGIDGNTQEIVLTGNWTQDMVDELSDRLHGGTGGTNTGLSSVDMSGVTLDDGVSLDGLFADCSNLTSVVLPDLSGLPDVSPGLFDGANPNCVVFVPNGENVPEDWKDQVNVVVDGKADRLLLVEGKPFHTPRPFSVGQALFQRICGTEPAGGWETVCLPFPVDAIQTDGGEVLHPVVATLTDRGVEAYAGNGGNCLEANTPYLFRLETPEGKSFGGKACFMATGEIQIGITQPYYMQSNAQYDWVGGFDKVVPADGIYVMNGEGTAFVEGNAETSVDPFEVYLRPKSESGASIPVEMVVPVEGISLPFSSASVEIGKSTSLSVTFSPADATNRNLIWSCSDNTVLSVSETGVVTGLKTGTAVVTVRSEDGGFVATCTITVTESGGTDNPGNPGGEDPDDPDNPGGEDPDKPTANGNVETLVIQVYPTQVSDYVHVGVL